LATSPVLLSVSDGIAHVVLHRPDVRNAVNDEMQFELIRVAAELRSRSGLRAVVVSGSGKGFCAGLDMAVFDSMRSGGSDGGWRPADADERAAALGDVDGLTLGRGQRAVLIWQTIPVPVIAAVHGAAVGIGLQIALGADIRIVSPDAKLGALESNWGLAPDSAGTQLLPRLVGPDVALEMCLTGKLIGAEEAVRIGLATQLAPDALDAAMELARRISSRSPDAMRSATRLIRLASTGSFQDGLLAEREEMRRNVGSPNQREAVAAARDRRAAVFEDS